MKGVADKEWADKILSLRSRRVKRSIARLRFRRCVSIGFWLTVIFIVALVLSELVEDGAAFPLGTADAHNCTSKCVKSVTFQPIEFDEGTMIILPGVRMKMIIVFGDGRKCGPYIGTMDFDRGRHRYELTVPEPRGAKPCGK